MFLARLLLLLALSAPIASAQYIAGKLNFNGAAPAQQRALEDTITLHPGQPFSAADLQAAAQRLSDTGAFDDVQVTLLGQYKSHRRQLHAQAPPRLGTTLRRLRKLLLVHSR